ERLRCRDHAASEVVDDEGLELDVRIVAGDSLRDLEEEAVALRQHVVLAGAGDLARVGFGATPTRELEGEADHPLASRFGDHLDGEATGAELGERPPERPALQARPAQLLERSFRADVEVLQVLPDDDEVDAARIAER